MKLWTVGHSTRTLEEFLEILQAAAIQLLVDVRSHPGSRKYPHFNSAELADSLTGAGVDYLHLPELGGRRPVQPGSPNDAWRNKSFQGYADHMSSTEFQDGLKRLLSVARTKRAAFMCSEAVWWRCHRSLIADRLKADGHTVIHLMGAGKQQEHPYTSAATLQNGQLSYSQTSDSG